MTRDGRGRGGRAAFVSWWRSGEGVVVGCGGFSSFDCCWARESHASILAQFAAAVDPKLRRIVSQVSKQTRFLNGNPASESLSL